MKKQSISFVLGEAEFTLIVPPIKQTREWRKLVNANIDPLAQQFSGMQFTFNNMEDISGLIQAGRSILFESIDIIFDTMLAYDPSLLDQRDVIESSATEAQIVHTFKLMLSTIDSFGIAARLMSLS
jgi:predicted lipoprotein